MEKAKVLVADEIDQCGLDMLTRYHEVLIPEGFKKDNAVNLLKEADAVIVRTFPLTAEVLVNSKNLRLIVKHGVGVDNIDISAATRLGIPVVSTPDTATWSVAEHAVALMLAVARKIVLADHETRQGNFNFRNQSRASELNGKVLGLIGCGRIGSTVAKICKYGFDMKVLFYDPYMSEKGCVDWGTPVGELSEILYSADIISIHCPLTSETRGLLDWNCLNKMKRTAILINTARGGIVDEDALVNALEKGIIAGAGIDVFAEEPLPKEHKLTRLRNVVLSPHYGAASQEAMKRMALAAARAVIDYFSTGRVGNIINPEVLERRAH